MYTIKEFAKMCGVTEQTLRNWDKSGKLPTIKTTSNHRRYTDEDLNRVRRFKTINVVEDTTEERKLMSYLIEMNAYLMRKMERR